MFLLLPRVIWVEGCIRYCLNTCFFGWSPLVPVKDTTLIFYIIVHYCLCTMQCNQTEHFQQILYGKWDLLFHLFAYKAPYWTRADCVLKLKSRPCCFDPVSISIWCFYVLCYLTKCVVKHRGWGFLHYSRNLPITIRDREVKMPGKITSSSVLTNPWQLVGMWLTLIKMPKKSSASWLTNFALPSEICLLHTRLDEFRTYSFTDCEDGGNTPNVGFGRVGPIKGHNKVGGTKKGFVLFAKQQWVF